MGVKNPLTAFLGYLGDTLSYLAPLAPAYKPMIYLLYFRGMALRITNCWLTTEDFGQHARAAWFDVIRRRDAAGE